MIPADDGARSLTFASPARMERAGALAEKYRVDVSGT